MHRKGCFIITYRYMLMATLYTQLMRKIEITAHVSSDSVYAYYGVDYYRVST